MLTDTMQEQMNSPFTNRDIQLNLSDLKERHYVLASAHPNKGDRFHVGPARGVLQDYTERFGNNFALILWKTPAKSPDIPLAFFVIPIGRVRAEFTDDRITRKDMGSWNAHVFDGHLFRTSEAADRHVDVGNCSGQLALPQRILLASTRAQRALDDMELAISELSQVAPRREDRR